MLNPNFVDRVYDTSEAILDMMSDCEKFNLAFEECFPMTIVRPIKINGAVYRMTTEVTMKKINERA